MDRDEALKVMQIAATLAAGALQEEMKGSGAAMAHAFRDMIEVVKEDLERLTSATPARQP